MKRPALATLLFSLIGLGVWSAAKLVHVEFTEGDGCPHLGPVPACLIALISYFAMLIGCVLGLGKPGLAYSWKIFHSGAAGAGLLAFAGSVFELIKGNTCPVGPFGIPMCFVSLAMSIAIGALGWWLSQRPTSA